MMILLCSSGNQRAPWTCPTWERRLFPDAEGIYAAPFPRFRTGSRRWAGLSIWGALTSLHWTPVGTLGLKWTLGFSWSSCSQTNSFYPACSFSPSMLRLRLRLFSLSCFSSSLLDDAFRYTLWDQEPPTASRLVCSASEQQSCKIFGSQVKMFTSLCVGRVWALLNTQLHYS